MTVCVKAAGSVALINCTETLMEVVETWTMWLSLDNEKHIC